MKVVEIFNSIDGEGKRAGELTTFIRLYGCNLNCSYCDSRYACEKLDEKLSYKEMAIDDIIDECKKYWTRNITVTGGEPLIHKDIKYLLQALSDLNYDVNVETNGSIDISSYYREADENSIFNICSKFHNVWFTVDYKCNSSGMSNKMYEKNFTEKYVNTIYKFVVGNNADLEQAHTIIKPIISNKFRENNYIYLSPVFGDIEPKEIVEFMQKNNLYNATVPIRVQLQLHKFIWPPQQRGV